MAISPSHEIAFTEDHTTAVVGTLKDLAASGEGWVNLIPEVEPGHDPPPRNPVAAIFSARGDAVPLATWTAPSTPDQRATIGIAHGSGPRALDRLAEAGLGLEPGWFKVADHARRGLVVNAAASADPAEVLDWLLASSHVLSVVPLTGSWLAVVYRS